MALTFTITNTPSPCNGGNGGSLVLSVSGGIAPYVSLWTLNGQFYSNDQSIYFLKAGAYKVVVTDSVGVTRTETYNLPNQFPAISPNLTISSPVLCSGSTGTILASPSGGSGSGYTYLWNTGATTGSITVVSGTYSVTVLDSSGCKGASATIYLSDASPITIEIEQALEECYKKTIILTANIRGGSPSPSIGYEPIQWRPNGEVNVLSIQAFAGQLYTVTASDSNGCTAAQQIYIPTQTEAWLCCLGKRQADQAKRLIKGEDVCKCEDDKNAFLYLLIRASERFSRSCLSDQEKQIITDGIEQLCSCDCGNVAAQQSAQPLFI